MHYILVLDVAAVEVSFNGSDGCSSNNNGGADSGSAISGGVFICIYINIHTNDSIHSYIHTHIKHKYN